MQQKFFWGVNDGNPFKSAELLSVKYTQEDTEDHKFAFFDHLEY